MSSGLIILIGFVISALLMLTVWLVSKHVQAKRHIRAKIEQQKAEIISIIEEAVREGQKGATPLQQVLVNGGMPVWGKWFMTLSLIPLIGSFVLVGMQEQGVKQITPQTTTSAAITTISSTLTKTYQTVTTTLPTTTLPTTTPIITTPASTATPTITAAVSTTTTVTANTPVTTNVSVSNSDGTVSISAPSGWNLNDLGLYPNAVIGVANDANSEYLIVTKKAKTDVSANSTINDYMNLVKSVFGLVVTNGVWGQSSNVTIGGCSGLAVQLTGIRKSNGISTVYYINVVASKDYYYNISGYTDASLASANQAQLETMIKSFKETN